MSDDHDSPSRRRFLELAGAGAAGALAGCLNSANADTFVSPAYDGGLPDRWEQQSEIERQESFGGGAVVAYIKGATHSDATVQQTINDRTLGSVDRALVIWNGSYINLEGLGAGAATPSDVLSSAKEQFEQRLRDSGIENVSEQDGDYVARADRVDAHTEYTGTVSIDEQTFTIPTADGDKTVTLDGQDLTVRAFIGVIDFEGTQDMGLVAGAYPSENFETTTTEQLSGDGDVGITVTVDVNLGLTPAAYRERLLNLVRAIQPPTG